MQQPWPLLPQTVLMQNACSLVTLKVKNIPHINQLNGLVLLEQNNKPLHFSLSYFN